MKRRSSLIVYLHLWTLTKQLERKQSAVELRHDRMLPLVVDRSELRLAGFEDVPYYGLFAKAGTPKATIDRMAEAISKVLVLPEVRERMAAMGVTVEYMTPEQLGAREQAYTQTWARIIRASGFQAQ
jgi:tripartite-type tricarboxylate transporter receptor subunit TctC